jgi:hypothetical protein
VAAVRIGLPLPLAGGWHGRALVQECQTQGGLNPFPPTDFVLSVAQVHGVLRVLGGAGSLRVLGHLPDSGEHALKLSMMG